MHIDNVIFLILSKNAYTKFSAGPYYVTQCDAPLFQGNTTITYVCLPAYLNRYFSSELEYFFKDCTSLLQVQMPLDYNCVPSRMFDGCAALREVSFPTSGTELTYAGNIENYAFCGCTSLTSISLLTPISAVATGAFSGCSSLQSIDLGDAKIINYEAFLDCISLESVNAPEVQAIGGQAFANCVSLTELVVSDYGDLDGSALNGCGALETVTFVPSDKEHTEHRTIEDGKIYIVTQESDGTTTSSLIRVLEYYRNEEITLREDCTVLRGHAFENMAFATYEIPASVERVESYAFYNCLNLETVTEEPGAKNIYVDRAFDYCPVLRIIDLSVRPWDAINLSGARKDSLYGYSCPSIEAVYLPGDDPNAAPLTTDSITAAIEAVFSSYASEMKDAGFTYEINARNNELSQIMIYTNKQSLSGDESALLKEITMAVIAVPEAELDAGLADQLKGDSFTNFQYFSRYFSGADKVELAMWEKEGCLIIITNN